MTERVLGRPDIDVGFEEKVDEMELELLLREKWLFVLAGVEGAVLSVRNGDVGGESGRERSENILSCTGRLKVEYVVDESAKSGVAGEEYIFDGGRYVIPRALCKPVKSRLVGIKAIVASPGMAPGMDEWMRNRTMESNFSFEKTGKVRTLEGSKYFHPRILLAAAGTAKIMVSRNEGSSWRSVASWQWSGLS